MEEKESQIEWVKANIKTRIIHRQDVARDIENQLREIRGEIAGLEWALKDIELSKSK